MHFEHSLVYLELWCWVPGPSVGEEMAHKAVWLLSVMFKYNAIVELWLKEHGMVFGAQIHHSTLSAPSGLVRTAIFLQLRWR